MIQYAIEPVLITEKLVTLRKSLSIQHSYRREMRNYIKLNHSNLNLKPLLHTSKTLNTESEVLFILITSIG